MRVHDLMSHPVTTCHVNDPLSLAAQMMWDYDLGVLPVVRDDGKLAGVITDRDICMAAYTQGRPLAEIVVRNVMTKHVITARSDYKLAEVAQLMGDNRIRRLPVVDAEDRPIGVVSLNDLALESIEPNTRMKNAASKVAHTLAAICQRRTPKQKAA